MENNKISILLASYKGQDYISAQIDSIISQTYSNWELLIRDDCSLDRTSEIIATYSYDDSRIRIIENKNLNLGASNNFFSLMKEVDPGAAFIMFCDQDDIWMEDKVERSLIEMEKLEGTHGEDSVLMVYGTYRMIDGHGKYLPLAIPDYSTIPSLNLLLSQNYVYGCTMMINPTLLKLSIPIPKTVENHDYWIVLVCLINQGYFSYIKEPLLLYRQHEQNVTGSFKKASIINRVNRIFSTSEIQHIKKRMPMFKDLAERLNTTCGSMSNLLNGYICDVGKGSLAAVVFCVKHDVRRRGLMQTVLFYLNLLRTKKFG